MGSAKKHARQARRMQTRTKTRGNQHTTTVDPAANNALLSTQLHGLGLYAVETLGDGNCLFRALSDQLYGTPSYHYRLRSDICDWIQAHKERYEPFVEDDRGFDVHLTNMRENGTYGGHMELSAFAHLNQINVKVIQPGLVYVIECDSAESGTSTRDSRGRKTRLKAIDPDERNDAVPASSTVYIAYHDWEHFSSVRNICGPHQGLPAVVETPAPTLPSIPSRHSKTSITLKIPKPSTSSSSLPLTDLSATPLPRSVTPSSQGSSQLSSASTSSLLTPDDPSPTINVSCHSPSPKRSLEESEVDEPYSDKKHRTNRLSPYLEPSDDEGSDLSSTMSTPAPESERRSLGVPNLYDGQECASDPPSTKPSTKPLTRRQRKALGLPKPRTLAPGKIVIPGGKHPQRVGKGWVIVSEDEDDPSVISQRHEWVKNGNGRIDVRGFKELKI